jgi:hypothetical protein
VSDCSHCPATSHRLPWAEALPRDGLGAPVPVTGGRGYLLACSACESRWFLDHEKQQLFRVSQGPSPLLEAWAAEPQRPPAAILATLASIGATQQRHWIAAGARAVPPHGWHTLAFPGQGRTRDGRALPRVLLRFQGLPPIEKDSKLWGEVLLARDLESLEPSPEALAPEVRQVSTLHWESGRGLACTPVLAPRGRRMSLNWTVHFLGKRGVVGQDLVLGSEYFSVPRKQFIIEEPDKIALVVADWDDGLLPLVPPKPPGLPEWMYLAWREW